MIEFVSVTAIGIILSQDSWSEYWILIPIAAIFAAKLFEYKVAVKEKHFRVRAELRLFMKLMELEDVLDVRCTYHVPVWGNGLFQTCDYIPSGGGGGRTFSRTKGIIGKAFVEKRVLAENFQDDEEFRQQMRVKYNYTADELRQRKADRKSYLCYPIADENHKVLGLIYLDSSRPNTFTLDDANHSTEVVMRVCQTIRDDLL